MRSLERQASLNQPAPAAPPAVGPVAKQASADLEKPVQTWISKSESGSPAWRLRVLLEPGGTAAEIQKALQSAPATLHFTRDTVFHGRELKAGQVVGAWPVEDDVAA